MKRILVIGATGNIGRQVVVELIGSGVHVRALTRNPDSANLPVSIEIVGGDLTEPATLDPVLKDADAVFLVWRAPAEAVVAAIARIAAHGPRVVFLSAPYRTAHPFFQQPNAAARLHAQIEREIEAAALDWTFLRPGMFAINALSWWAPQIRRGDAVRWPYAQAPTAPIHERDVASVAARVLLEQGHAGQEYVLTGPQSLTQLEQVSIIGDAIGRPLCFDEMSPEDASRELSTRMPPALINMLLNAWAAAIGQSAFVTTAVADITGTSARTFRDWAADHAAAFQQ